MTLIATVGDPTANSYGTALEADAYFTNHPLFDTWDAIVNQEALLIHATRLLDQLDYIGDRATTTQALEWPRISNDLFEVVTPSNAIPTNMKYAEFETALWVQQSGGVAVSAGTLTSLKVGTEVTAEYSSGSAAAVDTTVDESGIPLTAAKYLKGLRLITVLA